jgi:ribosomal protein L11 methyltransferase
MNTIQISISAGEDDQEILISSLSELGATGFEQQEKTLLAYFPELDFNSYEINEILKSYTHHLQTIEEQNWNQLWESNFQPVLVDDFCAIRADFHEPAQGVEHEILITPKMSFGTGHHATTYMMVSQMRTINFKGKTVFDFGTGTGILAILAEKLGAKEIYAIDVDDWSITNTLENMERNGCNSIQVKHTTVLPVQVFDVILANINRNVIEQYLPLLKKILQPGGQILFSGLLVEDGPYIVEKCEDELALQKREEKNNWLSLLFSKAKNNV